MAGATSSRSTAAPSASTGGACIRRPAASSRSPRPSLARRRRRASPGWSASRGETRLVVLPALSTSAEPLAWPLPRALGGERLRCGRRAARRRRAGSRSSRARSPAGPTVDRNATAPAARGSDIFLNWAWDGWYYEADGERQRPAHARADEAARRARRRASAATRACGGPAPTPGGAHARRRLPSPSSATQAERRLTSSTSLPGLAAAAGRPPAGYLGLCSLLPVVSYAGLDRCRSSPRATCKPPSRQARLGPRDHRLRDLGADVDPLHARHRHEHAATESGILDVMDGWFYEADGERRGPLTLRGRCSALVQARARSAATRMVVRAGRRRARRCRPASGPRRARASVPDAGRPILFTPRATASRRRCRCSSACVSFVPLRRLRRLLVVTGFAIRDLRRHRELKGDGRAVVGGLLSLAFSILYTYAFWMR